MCKGPQCGKIPLKGKGTDREEEREKRQAKRKERERGRSPPNPNHKCLTNSQSKGMSCPPLCYVCVKVKRQPANSSVGKGVFMCVQGVCV